MADLLRISAWSSDVCSSDLRDKLVPGKLLTCPGVFDGISLRLADRMGFECLYMTGYGTVASHLGLPDAGLASYRDMVDRVRTFASLARTPLVADGDTGYGGLLNVEHTVRGYEAAGARSEEHTSELQSLMRISYAVFCLKKKNIIYEHDSIVTKDK